jgi:hypothetical protein
MVQSYLLVALVVVSTATNVFALPIAVTTEDLEARDFSFLEARDYEADHTLEARSGLGKIAKDVGREAYTTAADSLMHGGPSVSDKVRSGPGPFTQKNTTPAPKLRTPAAKLSAFQPVPKKSSPILDAVKKQQHRRDAGADHILEARSGLGKIAKDVGREAYTTAADSLMHGGPSVSDKVRSGPGPFTQKNTTPAPKLRTMPPKLSAFQPVPKKSSPILDAVKKQQHRRDAGADHILEARSGLGKIAKDLGREAYTTAADSLMHGGPSVSDKVRSGPGPFTIKNTTPAPKLRTMPPKLSAFQPVPKKTK